MCDDAGGIVDDCTVSRTDDGDLVTTGLGATLEWIVAHARDFDIAVENRSSAIAVVAVQGPRSLAAMRSAGVEMDPGLGYFRAALARAAGAEVLVARIGYTGKLGYEVFAPTAAAIELWRALTRGGLTLGGALAFAYVAADVEGPLTVDGVARAAARRPLPFYDPERHRVRAGAGR
jgi:glycine cleavage system T protein (aminomethyltransferase)